MRLSVVRANGVHTLDICCPTFACSHSAILDVSAYGEDISVPEFGPRMICTACGAIGAAVLRARRRQRIMSA